MPVLLPACRMPVSCLPLLIQFLRPSLAGVPPLPLFLSSLSLPFVINIYLHIEKETIRLDAPWTESYDCAWIDALLAFFPFLPLFSSLQPSMVPLLHCNNTIVG